MCRFSEGKEREREMFVRNGCLSLLIVFCVYRCVKSDQQTLINDAKVLLRQLRVESLDAALFWNLVAIEAGGNDYDSDVTLKPEQGGATFSSRSSAIIHGAIFEAANVFYRFSSWSRIEGLPNLLGLRRRPTASAAVSEAAHRTLVSLYPTQKVFFDQLRRGYFRRLTSFSSNTRKAILKGIEVGRIVASSILKSRMNDGSQSNRTFTPKSDPGFHRVDPTHPLQPFVNPGWGEIKPFVIDSGKEFRSKNILGVTQEERLIFLNSSVYLRDYNEVKALGERQSSVRTDDQTEIGFFWGYDGAPKIGTPTRLYNQLVHHIARQMNNSFSRNAQLLGLVNFALADVVITTWETKYYYDLWRPIVAIREGSSRTPAEPSWLPLGAPSDGNGDNFTPGFPSYISGHAASASSTFEILRRFYRRDRIAFQFQSDEYNGKTIDSLTGLPRPRKTRTFQSFYQAEMENFNARIYLGIHWRSDQQYGQIMGRQIAQNIFDKLQ